MTDEWQSRTHRFALSGHKAYVTLATDEQGRPVLLEIRLAKAGGVLRGLLDALAASVLLGLQRGVPLSAYVERLALARLKHKACRGGLASPGGGAPHSAATCFDVATAEPRASARPTSSAVSHST